MMRFYVRCLRRMGTLPLVLSCVLVYSLFLTWNCPSERQYNWIGWSSEGQTTTTHSPDIDWHLPGPLDASPVFETVHAFYYAWYNAPSNPPSSDRFWLHWNHRRLPWYIPSRTRGYPSGAHRPPNDIGANFYPSLGPYASQEVDVMRAHLRMARFAGIGVLVLSWYPPSMADANGQPVDQLVLPLLNEALAYGIKICLHIEPYDGRTAQTVANDVQYAYRRGYASHPAYYRLPPSGDSRTPLPVFFVYDSYTVDEKSWASILRADGSFSIRGGRYNAYVVGLLISLDDCSSFAQMGFDAGYTYFAGQGTTYASFPPNWPFLSNSCRQAGVHFYPSVGPGYDDLAVRPYNTHSTVLRSDGKLYRDRFLQAVASRPSGVGITSFNEWGEGTQIEPATRHERPITLITSVPYSNYSPYSGDFYLRLTRRLVNYYANSSVLPGGAYYRTNSKELERLNQLLART